MATDERWSYSVGDRPHTVTVFERRRGGNVYVRIWDPTRGQDGAYRKRSLKYPVRKPDGTLDSEAEKEAKAYAAEQHAKLVKGESAMRSGRLALRRLFALYEKHRTPQKSETEQESDARRIEAFTNFLGSEKDPHEISRAEWDRYIELRGSGAIDSRGNPVPEENRRKVRPRTVAADLIFLEAALNWATDWRTGDGYLMRENPVRGFERPRERNPRRPVATDRRVEKIRSAAPKVTMKVEWGEEPETVPSHLRTIFELAVRTGRRLSSNLQLRYSDFQPDVGHHGALRWRADTDKQGRETVVPLSPTARRTLDRHVKWLRRRLPGIGDAPIFPDPKDPSEPVNRHVADRWLRSAEKIAEVDAHDGSLWHAYRRHWATVRKHLPAVDVAEAGGWAGPDTLQEAYQQADQETMYEVVTGGGELRQSGDQEA